MTRKDYIVLAAAFAKAKPDPEWLAEMDGWRMSVRCVAYALRDDNPRFNEATFFAACGYED